MISQFFFFQFVYMGDYVGGVSYTEPFVHPWDEAYLKSEEFEEAVGSPRTGLTDG